MAKNNHDYDFVGWATKNDLKCADGRTIRANAFAEDDGRRVPLFWNHDHSSVFSVLGHAELKNCSEGVKAFIKLNEKTDQGRSAKESILNGDLFALSIYANKLKQTNTGDVLHGSIKEVSLVPAGANPGAVLEDISFAHGDEGEDVVRLTYDFTELELYHSDSEEEDSDKEEKKKDMAGKERTVQDVIDTMNEEQKKVLKALVGAALAEKNGPGDDDDEEGDETVKHNVFDQDEQVLMHSIDMPKLLSKARSLGSLREAVRDAVENGDEAIAHSIDTTGMTVATGTQTYGFNDPSMLFPDYRALSNTPEWISREMGWVKEVMSGVHHTPFARIKSVYANITENDARAKGYMKGNLKREEVFTTLKRTTEPQTVYKKQKLDRDDIIDITDFDVIAWIRAEMRVMLDEELARAFLIGDGRPSDSDDKIFPTNIRPIVTDVPLFNVTVVVEVPVGAPPETIAKTIINEMIRSRKKYKGSGNPTFFTTEDYVTEMLLIEDQIGHKIYKTEAELSTTLRVSKITTVEPMEGMKVTYGTGNNAEQLDLIGTVVNLRDYNVGADKGGEVNMFDDFDIDYNQQKYLIETRCSGALVKPFSAITYLLKKVQASNSNPA